MPRIAISYRRDDSGVITGRIFDRLVARYGKDAIFRDIDNIPLGVDFRKHVAQIIDSSAIVLAVVGPQWTGPHEGPSRLDDDTDPVRVEIEIALSKDVPLVPVLVLGASMPRPRALPAVLKDFTYRNAVEIDSGQDFDVHMARLIRAMDAIVDIKQPASSGMGLPWQRRLLRVFAVLTALTLLGAIGYFYSHRHEMPSTPGATATNAPLTVPAGEAPAPVPPVKPPTVDEATVFWQSIAGSNDASDFEDFLRRFPNSDFAPLAERRIVALRAPPPPLPQSAPPVETPLPAAKGEATWTLDEKREVQRALRTLGYFQGEPDGGFGAGTRAAIKEFQEFEVEPPTGTLTEDERHKLLEMTQRLAALLDQPASSPEGVAGSSIKADTRYARGWAAEMGKGAKQDIAEAAYWYALAAADGDSRALANLGTILVRGYGDVKPEPKSAALLWRAAAARGNAVAMYNLGSFRLDLKILLATVRVVLRGEGAR